MNIVLRTEGYNEGIEEAEFTLEDFNKVLMFMKHSEMPFVNIMGKSPYLHSKFYDFIEAAISEEVYIRIILDTEPDDDTIERLAQVASTNQNKIGFSINLTEYSEENESLNYLITKLGKWSHSSVTITPEFNNLEEIIKLIKEKGMLPVLKLGFSLPAYNNPYPVLPLEQYKEKTELIGSVTNLRRIYEIGFVFDCGMPLCDFSNDNIAKIFKSPMASFEFLCSPRVEILPDLDVVHCSILASETKVKLTDFSSFRELFNYLLVYFKNYDTLYDKCTECWYKNKLCGGGCKGYKYNLTETK